MFRKATLLLAIVFIVCIYTGCNSQDDFPESYKIVLEKIYEAEKNIDYDDVYYPQDTFRWSDIKAYYALYDIDNNGIPELFICGSLGELKEIDMIWALKDNEPVKLPECAFSQRNRGWLLKNGIIFNWGTGSATSQGYSIYKMSANGYSVELEDSFLVDIDDTEVEIELTITQVNESDSKEITKDEFDAIMKSYVGVIMFPFDSEALDTVDLEWKSVESFFSDEQ